jgi:hypothetical protein
MVDVIQVDPTGEMPSETDDFIQIVRRADSDRPQRTVIDIDVFIAETRDRGSLAKELGAASPSDMEDAIRQAVDAAAERKIDTVYVADLTAPQQG